MVVFSNHGVGPHVELIVSDEVAADMLRATAAAARPFAAARWEDELVRWLERRAERASSLDVGDLAWTPEHFDVQRRFVIEAIARAAASSSHGSALDRWRHMIEQHPRQAVQVGRRWQWQEPKYSDIQDDRGDPRGRARPRV